MQSSSRSVGTVYLVGAGPGDPGLITISGIEALRRADVVLYDYLVNPVLTAHTPDGAELICLGKHGMTRIWSQEEINQRMVAEATQGRQVVRLKSGDPSIFGRLASEVEFLSRHQVPYVIIPGITAATAAGPYAGIPVTHRDHASAVAFVTGHEATNKLGPELDFRSLARFPGTLVIYMGVTSAARWSKALIDGGLDPETPVAMIRKCSLPQQETLRCQLQEVAAALTPYSRFPPPVIAIIGEVAQETTFRSWFTSMPLFGKTILVTRAREQSAKLQSALAALGAHVLTQPAIRIEAPESWDAVDQVIHELDRFDWVVFSSANGVQFFCRRLRELGLDARQFRSAKLAAIGPGTAHALATHALQPDLIPSDFRAESLADSLKPHLPAESTCLLLRASRGREVLRQEFEAVGAQVTEVVTYRSLDVEEVDPQIREALTQGQIDWITVTSSAIARALHQLFGTSLNHSKLASISPITTATLTQLGHAVATEATEFTMQGVVDAITRFG